MSQIYSTTRPLSTSNVPNAEQVRSRAIAQAQARGKWVAGRRLMMREIWHLLWTAIFPVLGLVISLACLILLAWSLWEGRTMRDSLRYLDRPESALMSATDPAKSPAFRTLQLDRQLSRQAVSTAPVGADPVK